MADPHGSERHEGPNFQAYMVVFGALSIFTAISFIVNATVGRNMTGLTIILGVAVIKAVLVGLYFMHLVVDWFKLYYLIFRRSSWRPCSSRCSCRTSSWLGSIDREGKFRIEKQFSIFNFFCLCALARRASVRRGPLPGWMPIVRAGL